MHRRIESLLGPGAKDGWLAPLAIDESALGPQPSKSNNRASDKGCLPISVTDYLQLIDWTGRQLAHDKRGTFPADLARVLTRLGIAATHWLPLVQNFGRYFQRVVGGSHALGTLTPRGRPAARFHPGRADLLGVA